MLAERVATHEAAIRRTDYAAHGIVALSIIVIAALLVEPADSNRVGVARLRTVEAD